ncbi:ABC transporter ATP-binding protein [Rhodoferax sp.]|uniref:ABC transporter ATP-binding protein n=1 Tax=Rhodoferax sp. TaxID=50421 RepID=UPI00285186F0|nr:ABC transporter ATP-binding protein [Rhodoferax sp.]MDR3369764.1 ABC transporter ATP-binding protein [Rhodoferax sp.]
MSDVLVQAHDLGRTYLQGGVLVPALVSASFSIYKKDRIAIIGSSGSGKSTLLHLMAALDTPSTGELAWPALGATEQLLPNKIALAFQSPSLLAPLTVAENVALPLIMGYGKQDMDAAVNAALHTFDLTELADKLPEELSGGQMQRVALARAIAGKPGLILADEPTGQLDHPTGRGVLDALLLHLEGTDTALVISTHDPAVAQRMSQVWRMHHGVLSTTQPERVTS